MDSDRISIKIADKQYPLRVPIEDQPKIKRAAAFINEKVDAYKEKYSKKEMYDLIVMTALQLATKVVEMEMREDDNALTEDLKTLNNSLDAYIKTLEQ